MDGFSGRRGRLLPRSRAPGRRRRGGAGPRPGRPCAAPVMATGRRTRRPAGTAGRRRGSRPRSSAAPRGRGRPAPSRGSAGRPARAWPRRSNGGWDRSRRATVQEAGRPGRRAGRRRVRRARLAGHVRAVHPAAPDVGDRAASSRPRTSPTTPAAGSTWPRRTRPRSSSSATIAGPSSATAGASIPGWADDPRMASRTFNARAGDPRHEPAVPRRLPPPPVPRPGGRLLRVAARRDAAPADADPRPRRAAARARGPVDGPAGPGDRRVAPDVHDRHDAPQRVHGPDPRPDAGRRPARRRGRRWLDPAPRDPGELRALLEPRDDVALDAYPVPPLVNNVRNNGPELIARIPPA